MATVGLAVNFHIYLQAFTRSVGEICSAGEGRPELTFRSGRSAVEARECWDIDISRVKCQIIAKTWVLIVDKAFELALGGRRIVPKPLHLERCTGPPLLNPGTSQIYEGLGLVLEHERLFRSRCDASDGYYKALQRAGIPQST